MAYNDYKGIKYTLFSED